MLAFSEVFAGKPVCVIQVVEGNKLKMFLGFLHFYLQSQGFQLLVCELSLVACQGKKIKQIISVFVFTTQRSLF